MIKIHKSKNGQYYFTVHAKNGAVLVTSEMYTRKVNTHKAIGKLERIMWGYDMPSYAGEVTEVIDLT
jgi:uncharacterized protein YegP (UPF0339 family)